MSHHPKPPQLRLSGLSLRRRVLHS
ncbi:rCG43062 [Rattus norvegicus]|uniref:RCG43062 n=1 Tax=Rattus norvegicus TaxID=10116 RepID=A6IVP1_RAT|nr:rCG43062 [Rattus norvegicus]